MACLVIVNRGLVKRKRAITLKELYYIIKLYVVFKKRKAVQGSFWHAMYFNAYQLLIMINVISNCAAGGSAIGCYLFIRQPKLFYH
jgi:hypothetical protein